MRHQPDNPWSVPPTPEEQYSEKALGESGVRSRCEWCGRGMIALVCPDCAGKNSVPFLGLPSVELLARLRAFDEEEIKAGRLLFSPWVNA